MFFGTELSLFVTCIIVVFGRIVDMSLATIRTIFTVKGKPQIAASIGFIEAFFWFLIVKAALDYIIVNPFADTMCLALSYSLGFALGTFLGGLVSRLFVKSKLRVQIVLSKKNDEFIEILKSNGFGQTILTCFGAINKDETYMVLTEIESKKLKDLKALIDQNDPTAFVSVTENKDVMHGYFSNKK